MEYIKGVALFTAGSNREPGLNLPIQQLNSLPSRALCLSWGAPSPITPPGFHSHSKAQTLSALAAQEGEAFAQGDPVFCLGCLVKPLAIYWQWDEQHLAMSDKTEHWITKPNQRSNQDSTAHLRTTAIEKILFKKGGF